MQCSHKKFEYTKIERMRNDRNENTEKSNNTKLSDEVNHSPSEQLEKLPEENVLGKRSNHRKKEEANASLPLMKKVPKKQFSAFIIR